MTIINWISISVLIVLVVVFTVVIILVKRKVRNYEGICGINHGNDDDHLNDRLL